MGVYSRFVENQHLLTYRMRGLIVLASQRPKRPGGRPGRGPPLKCDDGTKPDCECAEPPCNKENPPSCTCSDGSEPSLKSPCDNGEYPVCQEGACADGGIPVFTGNPLTNKPCSDGSKPNPRMCECEDGTKIKPPRRG